MSYIELHACSAFSFLRGGSFPEQLAEVAAGLEMPAMALLDRNGVYGVQRFSVAAREHGVRPIIGAELSMEDGVNLPVLVENRTGYKNLCELLTQAHLRGEKGKCAVQWNELPQFAKGLVALFSASLLPAGETPATTTNRAIGVNRPYLHAADTAASTAIRTFGRENVFVEIQRHFIRGEEQINRQLVDLAQAHRLSILATNGVQYAKPYGREVLDVFTCIREHTHLDAAGKLLTQNAERHLKSDREMRELFRDLPEAIENTSRLAERLTFSLENLGYEFPEYPVPAGHSMDSFLRTIVWFGAQQRYAAVSAKVKRQIEEELSLIIKLGFPGYFLIVWDIINFCREHNIMVQGRGSAANSAVCYCLGITPVDPVSNNLVFERFLNESRKGWPDIDLDLPSGDRRESVIQEIYRRYGKHGAAMTANVISYRGRSAAREIGKALNFSPSILDRFSHLFANGDFPHTLDLQSQIEQAGLPKSHPRMPAFIRLYQATYGLPRHLGQHSGGMIICQNKLSSFVPLENASMPGRVVAQWDKDDCEDLGIVKVDLLGLGMMSVMQDALELCRQRERPDRPGLDLAHIPKDDEKTFEIMQHADTIGVFQIESRAQMATLPRMKPKCFYDVVIEVAIIRPGPIQGDMVHPYLNRRAGKEPVTYFDERLKPVLERTLGVPLFQEQMLKIAMIMADFSGNEAEELRRALSFHRSEERMNKVSVKLRAAMERNGVASDKIDKIIQSISSFALYGFPESHAISFAILAYGSAYLKVHRAPEFYASLLNNQPMGFYTPATIVKDAQRHGMKVKPVCAAKSDFRCTVIDDNTFRLGFCVVNGFRQEHAEELVRQREDREFDSLDDFKRRVSLSKEELRRLAELGALNCFANHRRAAMWKVEETIHDDLLTNSAGHSERSEESHSRSLDHTVDRGRATSLCEIPRFARDDSKKESPLLPMTMPERVRADYETMNLTAGPHPMKLLREKLPNIWRAIDLAKAKPGATVQIAGNVICRQRPGTAKGFVFVSLEDETGVSNAIVDPDLFERFRLLITEEDFLLIEGEVQNSDNVVLIKTREIRPLAHLPAVATALQAGDELLGSESHDFR